MLEEKESRAKVCGSPCPKKEIKIERKETLGGGGDKTTGEKKKRGGGVNKG